jgi:serine protease Do
VQSPTRFLRLASALAIGTALALAAPGPLAFAKAAPETFAPLAEQLSPAVVNISTTQQLKRSTGEEMPVPQLPPGSPFEEWFKDFFDRQDQQGRPRRVTSLGSGFIIDPKGVIVTNTHVISEADEIEVTLTDGSKYPAELVGRDEKTDIAVLQVKAPKDLPFVNFGDSGVMKVGDWVMAIGNPFGLGGTVTAGIVSARNRDINAGPYDDFIQTDAAINRGNSGGPLFNMDGEVIGVNTAIISPTGGSIGIGFAVPSEMVKGVVTQLRQYGETRRGWIGVRIQTITDEIAQGLGAGTAKGALIAEVTEGGPAANSGLQAGDLITKFDGRDVPDMRTLPRIVAESEIGRTVTVEAIRKGEVKVFQVTLGRLEENDEAATKTALTDEGGNKDTVGSTQVDTLGLSLAVLNDALRQQYQVPADVKGVIIVDIKEDSPAGYAASEGRVRKGDVIEEVQQETVASPEDVSGKVKKVVDAKGKVVLLLLNRAGDRSFAALRLDQS